MGIDCNHVHDLLAVFLLQISTSDLNQLGQLLDLELVVLLQQHIPVAAGKAVNEQQHIF